MRYANPILWVDFETSGLDPNRHSIIEFAFAFSDGVTPIFQWKSLLGYGDDFLFHGAVAADTEKCNWQPEAYDLHKASGLYDVWKSQKPKDTVSLSTVDHVISSAVTGLCYDGTAGKLHKPLLAGSGVHFDRGFIERYLPETAQSIYYRNLDVSTLLTVENIRNGKERRKNDAAHRADIDVVQSFMTFRRLLGEFDGDNVDLRHLLKREIALRYGEEAAERYIKQNAVSLIQEPSNG